MMMQPGHSSVLMLPLSLDGNLDGAGEMRLTPEQIMGGDIFLKNRIKRKTLTLLVKIEEDCI